ncbi:MAG: bile acid:sodium symporter family protein [Tenuifilaceae bacterium]|jgi:BASS family bile acid:Na+ symporter|nr:bile acid:sodium symporter family protein [Tenuifilaceae bacterium]
METNFITELLLPLSLGVIMLGMGLSLVPNDFKRIALYPKAATIGIINQIIVLPLIGFLILLLIPMRNPELAVGIMILAACPGGPTSNLISHISRGDTALSISLTAISSLIVVFTIPLIVNFAMRYFLQAGEYVPLPVFDTMIKVIIISLVPVGIGMIIRKRAPKFADKMNKPVKIMSGVLLFLIIMAAILNDKENFFNFFAQAGPVALVLNVAMLLIGYFTARIFSLRISQSITISIESGIQNGTLGIAIAATLLNNPTMTISPAIYSLIMFGTAGLIIAWMNLKVKGSKVQVR